MTDPSILNATRIARIAQSENIEKATQMGFLDRIIDYFRGGIKRQAIEDVFSRIAELKGGSDIEESERLGLLLELRKMALPEHQHQFKYDVHENQNGTYECSITIGGVEIYKNSDIHQYHDAQQIPALFSQKFRLDIEDSAKSEDSVAFVKTLNDIDTFVKKELLTELGELTRVSVEDRAERSFQKMGEIFNSLPESTKEMLFFKGTSDFGNRLRGVLDFGYDILNKADASMSEQMTNDEFALLSKPLELQVRLGELIYVCAPEPTSEPAHSPLSGTEPVFVAARDENQQKDLPKLSTATITSHTELTEAESQALTAIGIPKSILHLL